MHGAAVRQTFNLLELLALRNDFEQRLCERTAELVLLPNNYTKVQSTFEVPGKTVPRPLQNWISLGNLVPITKIRRSR
jgi:hypothetical protein